MSGIPLHQAHARVTSDGRIQRRHFIKGLSLAALSAGAFKFTDLLGVRADELKKKGKACILLWMQGGPSQFETLDPKPGHANGGETKSIATSVPGLQIAENLPKLAKVMHEMAVIRSMTTKEGNHQRATFLLHSGYQPTASVKHPTWGSLVAQQLGDEACDLPSFVRIGDRINNGGSAGFLGVKYDPFVMTNVGRTPENTQLVGGEARFRRRLQLLSRLQATEGVQGPPQGIAEHESLYNRSARMILSPSMQAFDLEQETKDLRDSYGGGPFASGCLLARRLVESGVACVEVALGGWDTHQENFPRTKELTGQIDQPLARLITDLKDRGLLDSTLVVWMGEFGRTPRINPRGGRDHFPKAFNVAMAGCGIKGGTVIGSTSAGGEEVAERPLAVPDLFRTFCKALELDADHENMSPIGRPIKIVEGGEPVLELFS